LVYYSVSYLTIR